MTQWRLNTAGTGTGTWTGRARGRAPGLPGRLALFGLFALGGCAVHDSLIARSARTQLLGLREVDLVACLGAPDQLRHFASTDVMTWYATSTSSLSFSPPVVGGFSITNGGYCHLTARVDGDIVTRVLYSGEKNATLAPDAYCAPIVRSCLDDLAVHPPARGS